ncbi:MAG: ion transporter [Bacteroidales bacterium]|nr:ion transporter [Bacteroidales bacterium]
MKHLKNLFLNEKFILGIILLNAVVIYLQASGITHPVITIIDYLCTFVFLFEMIIKLKELGFKGYWSSGWNCLDGILVILSLPSLVELFIPTGLMDLSILLVLRVLRVLRFFRMLHFFPNFGQIIKGFNLALRESYAILLAFFVIIVIFGLINCSLFKDIAPEYFSSPLESIYSIFRFCTIDGWYDIPDTIAAATSSFWGFMVRLYFCLLLIMGGIIGMSFINSVFVDAMVADNNDDVKERLTTIEKKIDQLLNEKNEESNS